jgi:uncharacterized phiE125 gp8 family phage protein
MRVVVVEPPAAAVSLEEAKRHLRVDHPDDDALITSLIAAAQGHVDGPGGWLGRAIGVQTLEARLSGMPGCGVLLPYPPLVGVQEISFEGVTIDPQTYRLADSEDRITLQRGASWPASGQADGSVKIRYRAGYVEVPAALKVAILLMAADWYAVRENSVAGSRSKIPVSAEMLLAPFRMFS